MEISSDAHEKLARLAAALGRMESALVAFSGGVDSTFLLSAASEVLGGRVLAVTASSRIVPRREVEAAVELARELGAEHLVIETDEPETEEFRANRPDRCYHCKKALLGRMLGIAGERGIGNVLEASNAADDADYRPGSKAVRELGVRSPLREVGLTKKEIRELSQERGLSTWNKPAMACLATRIPYGEAVTPEKLERIEKGEEFVLALGFSSCRLRSHGDLARVEVPASELYKLLDEPVRRAVAVRLKELGFLYVSIDLEGYRQGSMNEPLSAAFEPE